MQSAKSTSPNNGGGTSGRRRSPGRNSSLSSGGRGIRASSTNARSTSPGKHARSTSPGKHASPNRSSIPVPATRSAKDKPKKRAPALSVYQSDEFARTQSMEWRRPGSRRGSQDADLHGSSVGSSSSRGSSSRGSRDPSRSATPTAGGVRPRLQTPVTGTRVRTPGTPGTPGLGTRVGTPGTPGTPGHGNGLNANLDANLFASRAPSRTASSVDRADAKLFASRTPSRTASSVGRAESASDAVEEDDFFPVIPLDEDVFDPTGLASSNASSLGSKSRKPNVGSSNLASDKTLSSKKHSERRRLQVPKEPTQEEKAALEQQKKDDEAELEFEMRLDQAFTKKVHDVEIELQHEKESLPPTPKPLKRMEKFNAGSPGVSEKQKSLLLQASLNASLQAADEGINSTEGNSSGETELGGGTGDDASKDLQSAETRAHTPLKPSSPITQPGSPYVKQVKEKHVKLGLDGAERLWDTGELEKAGEELLKVAEEAAAAGDSLTEGHAITRAALLYEEMGDLTKAQELHHRRLELAVAAESFKDQADSFHNISHIYLKQGQIHNFRVFAEKSKDMMKLARRGMDMHKDEDRGPSAAVQQQEALKEKEAAMAASMKKKEQEAVVEEMDEESEIMTMIATLQKKPRDRTVSDITHIVNVLNGIEWLKTRMTDIQLRALVSVAEYEKHQEGFPLYEEGDEADRAWVVLGCTPELPDYKGSVDILEMNAETKVFEEAGKVVCGGLIGEVGLESGDEPLRTNRAIVSDDGHDDTITVNHFMSFTREQFVEVISTYFHPKFQCYPTDAQLECQWADLGDQGTKDVCQFLTHSQNTVLTSLDMQYNNIGPDGATSIAELLAVNCSLRALDLSNNKIEDEGTTALCNALQLNDSLTSLSLRANCLTTASSYLLRETLQHNTSITALDVKDNEISFSHVMCQLLRPPLIYPPSTTQRPPLRRPPAGATAAIRVPPEKGFRTAGWGVPDPKERAAEQARPNASIESIVFHLKEGLKTSQPYQDQLSRMTPEMRAEAGGPLRQGFREFDLQDELVVERGPLMEVLSRFGVRLRLAELETLRAHFGALRPRKPLPPQALLAAPPTPDTARASVPLRFAYPYLVQAVEGGAERDVETLVSRQKKEEEAKREAEEAARKKAEEEAEKRERAERALREQERKRIERAAREAEEAAAAAAAADDDDEEEDGEEEPG